MAHGAIRFPGIMHRQPDMARHLILCILSIICISMVLALSWTGYRRISRRMNLVLVDLTEQPFTSIRIQGRVSIRNGAPIALITAGRRFPISLWPMRCSGLRNFTLMVCVSMLWHPCFILILAVLQAIGFRMKTEATRTMKPLPFLNI